MSLLRVHTKELKKCAISGKSVFAFFARGETLPAFSDRIKIDNLLTCEHVDSRQTEAIAASDAIIES